MDGFLLAPARWWRILSRGRPAPAVWPWRLLATGLVLFASLARLAYLSGADALDLAPDEAHYWDWSRHPDWGYYSKGPLVAWLIHASCALAGDGVRAVRLPAVVCSALLLLSLYVLTVRTFGREPLAALVVGLALTMPVITAGATLMTIDAPYACLWGWALVLGREAVFRRRAWAWPMVGLAIGLGLLAKFTMALWLPSLALFLLTSPAHRRLLFGRGMVALVAVAAACCLPVVWWNATHDWASLRHIGGQAGLDESAGWGWTGPFLYLIGQFALLGGYWFVVWVVAMVANRPGRATDPGVSYLWWMSAPMFAAFGLASLRASGPPNWPVTAYLSGLVLTAAWLSERLRSGRRSDLAALLAACVFGLGVTVLMHDMRPAYPWLGRLIGPPSEARPLPMRRVDPTCRLRGWRTLAAAVDAERDRLRAEGVEPVVAGTVWTLPGELAFYGDGRPSVYCFGPVAGDRHSQYDFWRPNPVRDPGAFRGRTFVLVGTVSPELRQAFDNVEAPRVVWHWEAGQPLAVWEVCVAHGFRGCGRKAGPVRY